MKRTALFSLGFTVLFAGLTLLTGCSEKPESNGPATAQVIPNIVSDVVHQATGTTREIDAAKGTVVVTHEPVKSMEWPAMSMMFTIKDKALMDKFAVDKTVTFEFKQQGTEFVVISVK